MLLGGAECCLFSRLPNSDGTEYPRGTQGEHANERKVLQINFSSVLTFKCISCGCILCMWQSCCQGYGVQYDKLPLASVLHCMFFSANQLHCMFHITIITIYIFLELQVAPRLRVLGVLDLLPSLSLSRSS